MSLVTINSSKKKLLCSVAFENVGTIKIPNVMIDAISVTQVINRKSINKIWKNPGTKLRFKLYPDGVTLGSIYRVVSGYGYIDKINYANSVYHNDNIVRYEIKVQSYTMRFIKKRKKNAQASISSKDC